MASVCTHYVCARATVNTMVKGVLASALHYGKKAYTHVTKTGKKVRRHKAKTEEAEHAHKNKKAGINRRGRRSYNKIGGSVAHALGSAGAGIALNAINHRAGRRHRTNVLPSLFQAGVRAAGSGYRAYRHTAKAHEEADAHYNESSAKARRAHDRDMEEAANPFADTVTGMRHFARGFIYGT